MVRPPPVAPPAADPGVLAKDPGVISDTCEDGLVLQLRMARAARRRAKRQRRRAAKAAAATVPGNGLEQPTAPGHSDPGDPSDPRSAATERAQEDEGMATPTVIRSPSPKRCRLEGDDFAVPPHPLPDGHPPSGNRSTSSVSHCSVGSHQSELSGGSFFTDEEKREQHEPFKAVPSRSRTSTRRSQTVRSTGKRPQDSAGGRGRGRGK